MLVVAWVEALVVVMGMEMGLVVRQVLVMGQVVGKALVMGQVLVDSLATAVDTVVATMAKARAVCA